MLQTSKNSFIDQLEFFIQESSRYRCLSSARSEVNFESVLVYGVSAIQRTAPPNSFYMQRLQTALSGYEDNGGQEYLIESIEGIANALLDAIKRNWLETHATLVRAELFEDFLEMADYLNKEGYFPAAATLGGGVLESHLRKLCEKNGIAISEEKQDGRIVPLKAGRLNEELAKASVYSQLEKKHIVAWLEIRNNAAHGKHSEYSVQHVELYLAGIRGFILNFPA